MSNQLRIIVAWLILAILSLAGCGSSADSREEALEKIKDINVQLLADARDAVSTSDDYDSNQPWTETYAQDIAVFNKLEESLDKAVRGFLAVDIPDDNKEAMEHYLAYLVAYSEHFACSAEIASYCIDKEKNGSRLREENDPGFMDLINKNDDLNELRNGIPFSEYRSLFKDLGTEAFSADRIPMS